MIFKPETPVTSDALSPINDLTCNDEGKNLMRTILTAKAACYPPYICMCSNKEHVISDGQHNPCAVALCHSQNNWVSGVSVTKT